MCEARATGSPDWRRPKKVAECQRAHCCQRKGTKAATSTHCKHQSWHDGVSQNMTDLARRLWIVWMADSELCSSMPCAQMVMSSVAFRLSTVFATFTFDFVVCSSQHWITSLTAVNVPHSLAAHCFEQPYINQPPKLQANTLQDTILLC